MSRENTYLIHYGILGQKWGQRNGPPYPLSSSDMNSGERRNKQLKSNGNKSDSGKWFKASIKGGKDKPPISPAEKVAKESKNAVDNLRDISSTAGKYKSRETSETARNMSDAELRKAINRIQMERQYDSLTTGEVRNGWDIASDVLSVIGGTLAVTASGLAIATTIRALR